MTTIIIRITQIRRLDVGRLIVASWEGMRDKYLMFQELDAVNKLITDGKAKANDIRNNLKNLETTSTRFVIYLSI